MALWAGGRVGADHVRSRARVGHQAGPIQPRLDLARSRLLHSKDEQLRHRHARNTQAAAAARRLCVRRRQQLRHWLRRCERHIRVGMRRSRRLSCRCRGLCRLAAGQAPPILQSPRNCAPLGAVARILILRRFWRRHVEGGLHRLPLDGSREEGDLAICRVADVRCEAIDHAPRVLPKLAHVAHPRVARRTDAHDADGEHANYDVRVAQHAANHALGAGDEGGEHAPLLNEHTLDELSAELGHLHAQHRARSPVRKSIVDAAALREIRYAHVRGAHRQEGRRNRKAGVRPRLNHVGVLKACLLLVPAG
eukprot:6618270-Prymnesium_polylepis.2